MIEAAKVIELCKHYKPQGQQQLYQMFARLVMGICTRYCNRTDADDMFQEVFIKIFQNIQQYRGDGVLEGWVRRIAVNTCLGHLKKNIVNVDIEDLSSSNLEPHDCENAIGQMATAELVEIINQLPIGYKTVFNLYVVEGFSHKEISETLQVSEGTSKSQLHHAKNMLKELLYKKNIYRYE